MELDANLINPFLAASKDVIATTTGIQTTIGKPCLKETKFDTTKHAEILAIQKASKKLESWRLIDCDMYVTLEPCSMCAGAIINSRIKNVYIGASDEKTGAVGSVLNLFTDYKFNHKVCFEKGILEVECKDLLQEFFKELRKIKNGTKRTGPNG